MFSFSVGRRGIGPTLRGPAGSTRRAGAVCGGQGRRFGRPRRSGVQAGRRTCGGLQTVGTAVGEAGWSLAGTADASRVPFTRAHLAIHRGFAPAEDFGGLQVRRRHVGPAGGPRSGRHNGWSRPRLLPPPVGPAGGTRSARDVRNHGSTKCPPPVGPAGGPGAAVRRKRLSRVPENGTRLNECC